MRHMGRDPRIVVALLSGVHAVWKALKVVVEGLESRGREAANTVERINIVTGL